MGRPTRISHEEDRLGAALVLRSKKVWVKTARDRRFEPELRQRLLLVIHLSKVDQTYGD